MHSKEVTEKEVLTEDLKYQEPENSPIKQPSILQVADQKNMWSRIADQAEPTKEKSKNLIFMLALTCVQDTQFAPYIGLGIGPTVFRLKRINGSPQSSMPLNVPWFAYQIKLGINYSIIPEVKTFLGYRTLAFDTCCR
ncbi:surface antigen-related protein [Trichonephila clavata]|uniref:Surface antigen-related protein n=1 Tax=Trichonephila clavata TaxID=2740835 RepID=A0A8X6LRW4_TRICU|nr:surface antigen-related protein [Trichonephila clavata]